MKPNINNLAKFEELKKTLLDKSVSNSTIVTIERALKKGIVFKKADDLALLNIPNVDLSTVGVLVDFGTSQPSTQNVKTFEFSFRPIGDEKFFYGFQFVLAYVNRQQFAIEESFPIEDSRKVYVDIDLNEVLDNSKVSYFVKSAHGEYAAITFDAGNAVPVEKTLSLTKSAIANASIGVLTSAAAQIPNPPIRGSYQIKGKVISNESTAKLDGYQVVIMASIADLSDGSPDYFPVTHAKTETNGYFVTGFLLFNDPDDVAKVKHAKAIVEKDDFKAEFPITLVKRVEGSGTSAVTTSSLPTRLILMINENQAVEGKDGCGCNDLNFHEKKVFEEFSYYTVVRTTEPSVVADVVEDEDEIDLEDIYGAPGQGIKVPLGVLKNFHAIKSRQISSNNFAFAAPETGMMAISGAMAISRSLDATALPSREAAAVKVPPPPSLEQADLDLIRKISIKKKVDQVVNGNKQRIHKGRTHLSPISQINWDKATIYQAASIAHGHLLRFKQEWIPDGYSIGDLLYSLPLAPGQKKQIAVLDWERRESAANSQSLDYEESLNNSLIRDRDVSEVVSATLSEQMHGTSSANTKAIAGGFGSAAMGIIKGISFGSLMGISGGSSKSSSSAQQASSRQSTGNSLQSIRDRTIQAANSVRSQRATVIQTVSQGERVQATSESVANYNHCHALTIQYFEVLRHFAVQNRFAGAQECLFIPLQITPFDIEKCLRWRNTLEQYLVRPGLRKAFDAIERIQNEKESTSENYYDNIGFPRKNYAEQSINFLQGELYFEFYFFNVKDSVDDVIINFFKIFRVDLNQFKDRKISDDELSQVVGPRTIEYLLDALVIETDAGVDLKLDITLISPFRQNARLRVSLNPKSAISIPRNKINGIKIRLDESKLTSSDITDIRQFKDKYMKIKVRSGALRYRTNNFSGTLFNASIENDLFVGNDSVFIPTPLNNEELRNPRGEDVEAANNLLHHLNENLEYYHKCLWFDMTPERRYMLLDGIVAPGKAGGRSVASVVENTVIGIAGNSLIMPVASGNQLDPTIDDTFDIFAQYYKEDDEPTRISLPTKGVYAEAVIGQCNSCEQKNESRFWRWEESPIPDSPNTQINPINTDTRRADPGDLNPKDFASPMINIQNAPGMPDPTGLQGLLQILGKGDSFRDITGLNENQKNALAAFQSSLQTAQAFGKEAADLAKTAGMLKLIQDAQRQGALSNEKAQEKSDKVIDAATPPTHEEKITRVREQLDLLKNAFDNGNITGDQINSLSEDALKERSGGEESHELTHGNIANLLETAKSSNANVSWEKSDGEKIDIDTQPRVLRRLTRDGAEETEEWTGPSAEAGGTLIGYPTSAKLDRVYDWKNQLLYKVPADITSKLKTRSMYVQYAHDESYSGDLNTDFYRVRIDAFPTLGGVLTTPETLIKYIRLHINDLIDTDISDFSPYDAAVDGPVWNSDNPLEAVMKIDIAGPDNASVAVTSFNPRGWRFSTVHTPDTGTHPVSGHRDFFIGRDSKNRKFYFVVKGLDMSSTGVAGLGFPIGGEYGFGKADELWVSLQDKLIAFINANGGSAAKGGRYSERIDWRLVYYRYKNALEDVFGPGAGSPENSSFFD